MEESGGTRYLRKTGWLKVYRREKTFDGLARERDMAKEFGMRLDVLDTAQARALEPSLNPVFTRGVFWPQAASISSPIGLTRAYVSRLEALGGVLLHGDARTLHRNGEHWRIDTEEGALDADQVVVTLGPWAPDLLEPLGIKLPLGVKRGYHRHFRAQGNASLSRPVLDADGGYCITPMEQGLRITTGAEIAPRDAPQTPVQFDRVMPNARELFPLDERADDKTWMGVAAVLSGFPARHRPRAGTERAVARIRPCALGADARSRHRPLACGHDDRRNAVLRSGALSRHAVQLSSAVGAAAVAAAIPGRCAAVTGRGLQLLPQRAVLRREPQPRALLARILVANVCIEVGAFRERGAKGIGDVLRYGEIVVDAAGRERHRSGERARFHSRSI